jgi:hypothetical protein
VQNDYPISKRVERIDKPRVFRPTAKNIPFRFAPVPKSFFAWIPDLSPLAVVAYVVICHLTWGFGKADDLIAMTQLCEFTGHGRTQVSRAISELEGLGLLRIERRFKTASKYRICPVRRVRNSEQPNSV